jgi:hypothetical protein
VFFLADKVPESWPETPKSASLTSPPADRRMFAALFTKKKKKGEEVRERRLDEVCLRDL